MPDSQPPEDSLGDAERIFAKHLAGLPEGVASDVDALCGAHPEHADSLRALRDQWRLSQAALDDAGRSVQVTGDGADDSAWLAFIEQLQSRGPAHTRYVFKGEIARGGMGVIQRVYDQDGRRPLAMKVILGKDDASPSRETPRVDDRTLGRFLEEAQVTCQLDHPCIVPVHEIGVDAAKNVYFTMKLVKGEDLRAVFDRVHNEADDTWNQTRALGLILRVCEAMAYAHEKQVIHRDLKPGNVMVGKFGEVYVMDWGLARVLDQEDKKDIRLRAPRTVSQSAMRSERREASDTPDDALLTMDGDIVGTPAYMPPEQAEGRIEEVGPRADIYALGAMLYHLLSGHMPYVRLGARKSNRMILMEVNHGPPQSIGDEAPDAPGELIAICEKAMSREIGDRYSDMTAFARDLRAFLENRVVAAYEAGSWAELKKWVIRNRQVAGIALVSVLLVGTLTAVYVRQLSAAVDAEKSALAEANAARDRAERSAQNARLLAVSGLIESGRLRDAKDMLSASPNARRDWVWEHLTARTEPFVAEYAVKDRAELEDTAGFSALADLVMLPCKTGLALFDTRSGERVRTVTTGAPIAVAFAARGTHAAILDASGTLELRETEGWSVVHSTHIDVTEASAKPIMRISESGELVVVSLERELSYDDVERSRMVEDTLIVWHPGREPAHQSFNNGALGLHPSGTKIYASLGRRTFAIDPESLMVEHWYDAVDRVWSIAHAGRGRLLLGVDGGVVEMIDEESGERKTLRSDVRDRIDSITVAAGSRFAYTSTRRGLCRLDLDDAELVTAPTGVGGSNIAVSPDHEIVICSRDYGPTVAVPAFFESGRVTLGQHDYAKALAFSGDGEKLVSLSTTELRVWDCKNARMLRATPIDMEVQDLSQVDVSPRGDVIAAIGRRYSTAINRLLWIWDAESLDLLHHEELGGEWGWSAACFAGDQLLLSIARCNGEELSGEAGGRVLEWDRDTATLRPVMDTEEAWLTIQPWSDHEILVQEVGGRISRWKTVPLQASVRMGSLGPNQWAQVSPNLRRLWFQNPGRSPALLYAVPDVGEEWKEPAAWIDVGLFAMSCWVGDDLLAMSESGVVRFRDAVSGETRLSVSNGGGSYPPLAVCASSGQIALIDTKERIVILHSDSQRACEAQIRAHASRVAESLVSRVAAEALSREVLVGAIQSHPNVTENVRDQALLLAQYVDLATPASMFSKDDAFELILGVTPSVAREMSRRLELIGEFDPEYFGLRCLGIALYRSGDYPRALQTVRATAGPGEAWETVVLPSFEALALAKLGMGSEAIEIAGRMIPLLRAASELAPPISAELNPLGSLSRELEEMVRSVKASHDD